MNLKLEIFYFYKIYILLIFFNTKNIMMNGKLKYLDYFPI